ncbi:hypothetical protein QC762_0029300 [Podospora pseudocomata]|uniref:Uncharacterized protein n=1 Tax=Podospora pseudocomata TaxID=2093779 RepID=A0ABR0GSM2_9PEZI|nr:hypothetical protein QC762_0029300 [Podospora pseudocomata]
MVVPRNANLTEGDWFLDLQKHPPEVMGEGGDICEVPTIEISKRRRARPPPSRFLLVIPISVTVQDCRSEKLNQARGRLTQHLSDAPRQVFSYDLGFPDSDMSASRNPSARPPGKSHGGS